MIDPDKFLNIDDSPLQMFSSYTKIEDYMIDNVDYNSLNKLRKIPCGSLFYWNLAIKLMEN